MSRLTFEEREARMASYPTDPVEGAQAIRREWGDDLKITLHDPAAFVAAVLAVATNDMRRGDFDSYDAERWAEIFDVAADVSRELQSQEKMISDRLFVLASGRQSFGPAGG